MGSRFAGRLMRLAVKPFGCRGDGVNTEGASLAAALLERKDEIVREWLERTLHTYPESITRFLSNEKDPFRNPVGYTLREGLSSLLTGLIRAEDTLDMAPVLDGIVRIRAVQDFSASQAVAFIFLLKHVLGQELQDEIARFPGEFALLETRIDELALLSFDIFMKCREQIHEIKTSEARRMLFVSERPHHRERRNPNSDAR